MDRTGGVAVKLAVSQRVLHGSIRLETMDKLKTTLDELLLEHLKLFKDETTNNKKTRRTLYFMSNKLMFILNNQYEGITTKNK